MSTNCRYNYVITASTDNWKNRFVMKQKMRKIDEIKDKIDQISVSDDKPL